MRPNDIIAHLRKRPFHPVRVFISDGKSYDVRHPEMMMVGHTEVVIGVANGKSGPFERLAYCDPIHITRIEPLPGKRARKSRKRPPE